MKKLMILALGLSLALGTVATFAQETPKKEEGTGKKGKKGKKAPKKDDKKDETKK